MLTVQEDKLIHKSIIVHEASDYSILKHHINELELEFECKFKENNVIDFYDEYLYLLIKKFMTRTKIKSKINKEK